MINDAAASGSSYDNVVTTLAGTIPDATKWWPVTGGTLDKGTDRIDRSNEARGRRARTRPLPFRGGPGMTVPVRPYHSLVKVLLKYALGREGTITGAGPYTHPLRAVEYSDGVNYLPTAHVQLARDDLNQKMSGASLQRLTFDFPLDGDGSMEAEWWGLYQEHYASAVPAADFSGLSEEPMLLRDAQVFIDGSGTAIPDLQGVRFAWVNNLRRRWYAGRNIKARSLGTPPKTYKNWYPEINKIGASQDVTFGLIFGDANSGQELAEEYAQVEKYVVELVGMPITGGAELLRLTIFNGVLTEGGAGPLTAQDDLSSDFNGGVFYSEADSKDVLVEVVDDVATAIPL